MLIDNDFVNAEHLYRRHRLSALYTKKRRRRSEDIAPARSNKARAFEVKNKKVRQAIAD